MKTPEEIKKGLACCNTDTDCDGDCPYYRQCEGVIELDALERDALAYIRYLEDRLDACVEMANTDIGKETCANCKYGDGTITDTDYCLDCRWFDSENGRIKWVGTPKSIAEMLEEEESL